MNMSIRQADLPEDTSVMVNVLNAWRKGVRDLLPASHFNDILE